jgi:hypothetical protein
VRLSVLAALICALLLAMPVCAQIDTGIISGRVVDPTGAVVAGAQVTIVQTEMSFENVSQTNSEGLFRVQGLRPGPYRVSVSATGFKKYVRDGLQLRIGENQAVDAALEVGAVAESVEVTGAAPLLETQTSSTGQVMGGDYFYKLPNYQHWEKGVLFVTPNVQTTNTAWAGQLSNFHINGGQSWQIGYFEDGQLGTAMDGGNTINSISASVEEVKVLSTVLPAEYGHSTTGAITVVKKTGTNDLHGSGTWLFATRSMVHRRFFELQSLTDKHLDNLFQQPDTTVTGPVYIPGVYNGKNKTFFMYGGSFHMDDQAQPGFWSVPTQDMLNGVFNWTGANAIYDPNTTVGTVNGNDWSRVAFPNNTIPKNRISNVAKAIFSHNPFTAPNYAGTYSNTGISGNLTGAGETKYHGFGHNFRLDHQFSQNYKVYVSYTRTNNNQHSQNMPIAYQPYDANQRVASTIQQVGSVGFNWFASPTLIFETRVGFYRTTNNPVTDYQMAMANTFVNEAKVAGIDPDWYVNAIGTGFATGPSGAVQGSTTLGNGTQNISVNGNHTLRQDVTKVWGSHAFKMGYEWLWENQIAHDIGNMRVGFTFGGTNGLQANGVGMTNTGGITLADLMLGYVTGVTYNRQGLASLPEDSIHSFYFQDDWRIHPNLTLNLGLRYSTESPAHMKFPGMYSIGSLDIKDDVYATAAGCASTGCIGGWIHPKGGAYNRDKDNFQPRVGFAWTATPGTVIRGGFALNTLDMNNWYTNQSEIGGGSFYSTSLTQPGGSNYPLFQIDSGVPAPSFTALRADGTLPNRNVARSRGTLNIIPANFHNPYTLNWNFSVQRALKRNYVVEASYSGSHNVGFQGTYNWQSRPYAMIPSTDGSGSFIDLSDQSNWNYRNTWVNNADLQQASKPIATWSGVNYYCNCISTIYHSATAKIEKRYSYGLAFSGFFTWSKGLQNSTGNLYIPSDLGRSRVGYDQKFRYVSSMTYELPFGKGQKFLNRGGWLNYIAGGWSLAWNYSIYTGNPMNISISGFNTVNPLTGASGARQDYPSGLMYTNGNALLLKNPTLRDHWQDLGENRFVASAQNSLINCGTSAVGGTVGQTAVGNNCITGAPSFTNGNLPGNSWDGHRFIAANMSAYKDIPIKERVKAQFRLDFYNPFKWYNWDQPSTSLNVSNLTSLASFGKITSLTDAAPSTNGGPPLINVTFAIKF